ncbi:acetate--CoA ligase family protein [Klebsiella pneumoniae subsp. pneumoniae]|nr:acetate--CoA ligase family protein [Klebsiella pneumoniae subsp. pneumoniae]
MTAAGDPLSQRRRAPGTESALALIDALKHHPRGKYVTVLNSTGARILPRRKRDVYSAMPASLHLHVRRRAMITAFYAYAVEYRRNQKQLRETPVLPDSLTANTSEAHASAAASDRRRRHQLDTTRGQPGPVLRAAGIHTLPTWIAADSAEAVHIAEQIGYPVALKCVLRISRTNRKYRVMLYLRTAAEVQQAADAMIDRVKLACPGAHPWIAGAKHGQSRWRPGAKSSG